MVEELRVYKKNYLPHLLNTPKVPSRRHTNKLI